MNFFKQNIFLNINRKSVDYNMQAYTFVYKKDRDIRKTAITSVLKDSIYLKPRMNKKYLIPKRAKTKPFYSVI